MPTSRELHPLAQVVKRSILLLVLPRLAEFKHYEWDLVLKRACDTAFDSFEWAGVLISLTLVTWLLQDDSVDIALWTQMSLSVRYLVQYLMALPLLFILTGSFYLRRIRRGLDVEIARQRFGS